ncbi:MAG: HU family DNA-binding protein [Bacteroidales bacterium]|nr:HU family DNA-binding protein [Bacteroidales bacterium]
MNEKIQSSDLISDSAFTAECFKLIAEVLPRDKYVKVKGLGTFKLITVESRESVDVNTGERILINSHPKITFTPDTALRDIINEPFACFETTIINEPPCTENPLASKEAWDNETLADSTVSDEKPNISETDKPTTVEPLSAKQPGQHPTLTVDHTDNPNTQEGQVDVATQEKPSTVCTSPRDFFSWGFICKLLLTIVVCGICYFFNDLSTDSRDTSDTLSPENEAGSAKSTPDAVSMFRHPDRQPPPTPLTRGELAALHPDDPKVTERDTTQLRIVGTLDAHTLEYGETLAGISLRYYGRRCYWPYIAIHNRLSHAHRTLVGTVIQVPRLALKDSDTQ